MFAFILTSLKKTIMKTYEYIAEDAGLHLISNVIQIIINVHLLMKAGFVTVASFKKKTQHLE